jgi:RNA polymerase sigma-70 factor (ECF subfamily)
MPQPSGAGGRRRRVDTLAQLYDRHAAGLYRYALMVLLDHALAEDAVQQVFSKLLASGRANRLDSADHYLRRAIRNECYSFLQKRRPRQDDRPLLEAMETGPGLDPRAAAVVRAAVSSIDERLMLEAALRELPVEQREVLTLRVYEGLTFREIADVLGVSQNTAAGRYRYAIRRLRALIGMPIRTTAEESRR